MARGSDAARTEARRRQVALLMATLHNPSVRRIRDALEALPEPIAASKSTVHRDIEWCREEWKRERLRDLDEVIGEELTKLSLAEDQIWRAIRRSQQDRVRTFTRTRQAVLDGEVRTLTNTYTENVEGGVDPRLFRSLVEVLDRRARLLGLDAPKGLDLRTGGKDLIFRVDIGEGDWTPPSLDGKEAEALRRLRLDLAAAGDA